MNGAIVEPWASINNPPITNIVKMIGASQSFLRTRKKDHNSEINSKNNFTSILLPKISYIRRIRSIIPMTLIF